MRSAIEIAEQVRSGQRSPLEIVEEALTRLDRVNPRINAVVTRDDDAARAQAERLAARQRQGEELGPLAGVPLLVKDLHLTAGLRTTFGSRLYENFVPRADCPFVARLRAAGAIVIGKTNTSEFGLLPLTSNARFGPSRNPWNEAYDTGGSSGGSAAAVACGVVPIATGSDGGGSIRVPAAWCGVFGLKPQLGRIPRAFHVRGWESLSHEGPITRSVRDAARMLDVASGFHSSDRWSLPKPTESFEAACDDPPRDLRVAWCAHLGDLAIDDEVVDVCAAAARRFAEFATFEEIELDLPDLGPAQQTLVLAETLAAFGPTWDERRESVDPKMARMIEKASRLSVVDVQRAQWLREEYWDRIAPVFERFDALLTPVTGIVAAEADTIGPREIGGRAARALAWIGPVVPANMTGQPACTLPAGKSRIGLPIGLQMIGRPHDEATLLRLAAASEAWWKDDAGPNLA